MSTLTLNQFLALEPKPEIGNSEIWNYVSPSRISLFFKCPWAFKKKYIDGWDSLPSPSLTVGKVVHAVLAHVYQHRIASQVCNPELLPTIVADCWQLTMSSEPCYFDNSEQEKAAQQQVLDLCAAYVNTVPVQEETPLVVEKRFEMPLVDPFTGEDFGIPLVGVVDLVLEEPGNSNVIIDFKTSATAPLWELQHETQLNAYAYLFREATGLKEERVEIRQLVKHKVPKIQTHRFAKRSDEHMTRFFGLVREYLDGLDRGIFNCRPGYQCQMCEHCRDCC
jgi:RecB family exonuclease